MSRVLEWMINRKNQWWANTKTDVLIISSVYSTIATSIWKEQGKRSQLGIHFVREESALVQTTLDKWIPPAFEGVVQPSSDRINDEMHAKNNETKSSIEIAFKTTICDKDCMIGTGSW